MGHSSSTSENRSLNLLALLPCPLKIPVEEAFSGFLKTLAPKRRIGLTSLIEGNANTQIEYADLSDRFDTPDDIPDIMITPGFNSLFHPRFVERFIKTGRFTSVNTFTGDRRLSEAGIIDSEGHYTMLAMNLLVLVVDHDRLGNRPVPRSWPDLLNPGYEKSIAIRGNRADIFCETLLMTLHKEFGLEGIAALGRNVAWGWHPSQMVKAAGSGREDSPAISAMPLFFARNIRNREKVSVVWPGDGALVSPVSMLVKSERREELGYLVDFLMGKEVASICAGAHFPALHPEVDNGLPDNAPLKWLGWDYIRNRDLKALIAETNAAFLRTFRGGAP